MPRCTAIHDIAQLSYEVACIVNGLISLNEFQASRKCVMDDQLFDAVAKEAGLWNYKTVVIAN